jgi:hypothetical protein
MSQERYQVFFIIPTNKFEKYLTRYGSEKTPCPKRGYSCTGSVLIETVESEKSLASGSASSPGIEFPLDDQRWPTTCNYCGNLITNVSEGYVHYFRLWTPQDRSRTPQNCPEFFHLMKSPTGACWDANWLHDHRVGPDGRSLYVMCPDHHEWFVDGIASNCTRKDDKTHRCWCRQGKPEDGTLNVDKNCDTCQAGAGSILTPNWHGFLRNGFLEKS